MVNILFICRHNMFRSKVAESYAKKLIKENKIKNIKVKSAGIIKGNYPLMNYQKRESRLLGIRIKGKPVGVSIKLLNWADKIIIVADDVPKQIFEYFDNRYNVKVWNIKDEYIDNKQNLVKIIKSIMKNVKKEILKN